MRSPSALTALVLFLALAAWPARAQAPAPVIEGHGDKGGVMRNLPPGASKQDIETRAADYCLHYALDYAVTGTDPKGGVAFDCTEPGD